MSTFLLIPGAGGMAWYWHLVEKQLRDAGHEAIALDLPADDPNAGLTAYAHLAVSAARGRGDLVVAAQSMGSFNGGPGLRAGLCTPAGSPQRDGSAPGREGRRLVGAHRSPGGPPSRRSRGRISEEFDLHSYFLHDVPPEVLAEGPERQRDEAEIAFEEPCPFARWPDIPTTVLAGRDDRFFPFAFQQHVARERLAAEAQPLPGGHLAALSHPEAVTRALLQAE